MRLRWWISPLVFTLGCSCCGLTPLWALDLARLAGLEGLIMALMVPGLPLAATIGLVTFLAGFDDLFVRLSRPPWRPRRLPWQPAPQGPVCIETRGGVTRIARSFAPWVGAALLGALLAGLAALCLGQLILLVLALPATWLGYRLLVRLTGGHSRVEYLRFPYVVRRPIAVRFGIDEGASPFVRATYHLSCVKEMPYAELAVPFGINAEVVWTTTAGVEPHHVPEPGGDVEVVFEPPHYLPPAELHETYRTLWEFRVEAETTSGRYDESFLLPVLAVED